MTDQELADKIVALGVLRPVKSIEERTVYQLLHAGGWTFIGPASYCVRDWRVAGALMEKCEAGGWDVLIDWCAGHQPRVRLGRWKDEKCSTENTKGIGHSESLPRAICEACVEALTNEV